MTNSAIGNPQRSQSSGVALYHDMRIGEDFECCAARLFETLRHAQQVWPGSPRVLYLDVQGHRNELGGFDDDAYEIMSSFIPEVLMTYLTEIHTPLYQCRNSREQSDDVPPGLVIESPADCYQEYDIDILPVRPRETRPASRKSPPSVKMIADYLGLAEPRCVICWQTPVERAHALARSLGGSYDVRNFILLCRQHHEQAPDVADAIAFWSWVDYMSLRDGHKWKAYAAELEKIGLHVPVESPARMHADFIDEVRRELIELYGWQAKDFDAMAWDVTSEFHTVLDKATGEHFGVRRKASTYAWAYEIARKRAEMKRSH